MASCNIIINHMLICYLSPYFKKWRDIIVNQFNQIKVKKLLIIFLYNVLYTKQTRTHLIDLALQKY